MEKNTNAVISIAKIMLRADEHRFRGYTLENIIMEITNFVGISSELVDTYKVRQELEKMTRMYDTGMKL